MNVRYDIITCFVIRQRAGGAWEFLQLRRAADDHLGGTWQVVRGSCETDEPPTEGALRELREETGICPKEFYRLGNIEIFFTPPDTVNHSIVFCAVIDPADSVILNPEHDDLRWIDAAKMHSHAMWSTERPLIDEIFREIIGDGFAKPHLRINVPSTRP